MHGAKLLEGCRDVCNSMYSMYMYVRYLSRYREVSSCLFMYEKLGHDQ